MLRFLRCIAVAVAVVAMPMAHAQLNEIVVTGERVSGDDYSRIPAIALDHRADFLVQLVELTNDTRAAEGRAKELHETIRDMAADAAKHRGMALSYGEEFLIPITTNSFDVPLDSGGKRPDTSSAEIYVKMSLGPKDDVSQAIATLADFIKKARASGRTEIKTKDDVGLSLVGPEKYRYDIVAKITEDARHLQDAMAAHCKIQLTGLSNRVSWKRSDVSTLTLYIPYQIELKDCG